jgi:hypothetical protein
MAEISDRRIGRAVVWRECHHDDIGDASVQAEAR